jgi:predicted XRE-type DNA-binding protein
MTEETEIYTSCGNVFADLGFDNPDEMLAKAELVRQITLVIKQRQLDEDKVSKLLQIDQTELLDLLEGNLTLFSAETLIRFLNKLGQDVEIVIKQRTDFREFGTLKVVS